MKKIISMIFRGLLNLFQAGYMHLDLKPENILVEYNEEQNEIISVKITDLDSIPEISQIVRMEDGGITPEYFDPLCIISDRYLQLWKDKEEYKDFENIFAANDLYSLGIIIYILYLGVPPELSILINNINSQMLGTKRIKELYEYYHTSGCNKFKAALDKTLTKKFDEKKALEQQEKALEQQEKALEQQEKALEQYKHVFNNRLNETIEFMGEIIDFLLSSNPNDRLIIMNDDYEHKRYLLSDIYPDIWATSDSEKEADGEGEGNTTDEEADGEGEGYTTDEEDTPPKKTKINPLT